MTEMPPFRAELRLAPTTPAGFSRLCAAFPDVTGEPGTPLLRLELSAPTPMSAARMVARVADEMRLPFTSAALTSGGADEWLMVRHTGSSTSCHALEEWLSTGVYRLAGVATMDRRDFVSPRFKVVAAPGQWLIRGPQVGVSPVECASPGG